MPRGNRIGEYLIDLSGLERYFVRPLTARMMALR